jgi:hypothetical protein
MNTIPVAALPLIRSAGSTISTGVPAGRSLEMVVPPCAAAVDATH